MVPLLAHAVLVGFPGPEMITTSEMAEFHSSPASKSLAGAIFCCAASYQSGLQACNVALLLASAYVDSIKSKVS